MPDRSTTPHPDPLPQTDAPRTAVASRIDGFLLVTAPSDLGDGRLEELQETTLTAIRSARTKAVILDLAGVNFMDSAEFADLRSLAGMVEHLGARAVIIGLRPGIIAHLVQTDTDLHGMRGALGLDEALQLLGR